MSQHDLRSRHREVAVKAVDERQTHKRAGKSNARAGNYALDAEGIEEDMPSVKGKLGEFRYVVGC